jgi:hypothetical protein
LTVEEIRSELNRCFENFNLKSESESKVLNQQALLSGEYKGNVGIMRKSDIKVTSINLKSVKMRKTNKTHLVQSFTFVITGLGIKITSNTKRRRSKTTITVGQGIVTTYNLEIL